MAELSRASAGIPFVSFETLPESFGVRSGWNRYSNDVMVIDSCGRLTYQVVMPWSSLQYPYVKAAVISTLIDQPCGPCNVTQKKPKLTESHTLNATLYEKQETQNKTQSKLASIVNQYKPRQEDKGFVEDKEHFRDADETIREVDIDTETTGNDTQEVVIEDHQLQLTETLNATETNLQMEIGHSHKVLHKDTLAETTEKMSKGKKKLSSKKLQSKLGTKNTKDDEIAEERSPTLLASDLELEKSIYSPAGNYISSEVTLAPLQATKDGLIPIRVIMRSPHEHNGKTYDYLEMQLGNPGYHGHLEGKEKEIEQDLEEERKELQLVDDDFDAIGAEEKQNEGDDLIMGYGNKEETGINNKEVANNDKDSILEHPKDSVIDAVKVEETSSKPEGTDKNNEAKIKSKKMEKGGKKEKGHKTKLTNLPEQKIEDSLISSHGDGEGLGQEEKKVDNDDKDLILEHAEKSVIDAVKVEETTPKQEGKDKSKEAAKKNKKTEKEGKKSKGNKTKLTNIPEQEWMKAEIKDIPDKFDDIYPQVNDFVNDVREEESNHKNEESVLDDLTVTDLKYLIDEMGLEVNAAKEADKNNTVVLASVENTNESKDTNGDVIKNTEMLLNLSKEVENVKKGHHKSAINSLAVTEKTDNAKDSKGKDSVAKGKDSVAKGKDSVAKGKDSVAKGKESDEIVNRTKVTLTPTLSESTSELTSGSDGSSKEVMEHYSKLLPWIDYHL